ncbi:DUF4124 domain-containing protein [Dokdonella soli]|uniref:DUF4124 domain-containing protein n=1 Tax=Dokdonella soli TaxID=529810 RepID=A0ABN1IIH4_9GAMM
MKRNWLLLALLTVGLPAAAADMYSWTDANGVKHFSDSPPPASVVKAQKLKVKGGVTTSTEADGEKKAEAAKSSGPALAAAAGYAPEDIKRNCDIAKKNLAVLDTQKVPVDSLGYPTDLDAAKSHQAQIDKANQQIKLFCAAQ